MIRSGFKTTVRISGSTLSDETLMTAGLPNLFSLPLSEVMLSMPFVAFDEFSIWIWMDSVDIGNTAGDASLLLASLLDDG